ncbi:alanine--tRNA ligase, partial [Candidatus Uhrbacteria bacterium]|nr:alanine--tRNA ligase [Candidatus Uhrbacteria bacterium]
PELQSNKARILSELQKEEEKFARTLEKGLKEFEHLFAMGGALSGAQAFVLYSTYGFPLELSQELAQEQGQRIDEDVFHAEFKKHQELSRAGSEQKFHGGLADHSEEVVKQHTATHLLQQALRTVLGPHVYQKGSNITRERLRFDFSHPAKMTPEEIKKVEEIMNEQIRRDLPVHFEMLTVEEAKARGAIGLFDDKYSQLGNKIKVYFVGDYSKEICGGPHVEHTGQIGGIKIVKEEAVSAGIRRIKAILTP